MALTGGSFDPAAATAAYLAQLPPAAHARAEAYTQGGHWILLWSALVGVAISWLVLRSQILVRLRRRVSSRRRRFALAALVVVAAGAAIETGLSLPWNAYADWWREKAYGLTSQGVLGWLGDSLIMGLIYVVVVSLLMSGIYALIRRAPRSWWLWSAGVTGLVIVLLLVISPVFIQPIFNRFTPAPPGAVRDAVVQLAQANGVPADRIVIFDGSRQSNRYTAHVSGLFGTARIAMSDVMFRKGADLAEVRAVVGHEMGHYAHRHTLIAAGLYTLLALVAFLLVDRLFTPALALAGADGVEGLADPAGFPVIGIIITALTLLGTPLTASITRLQEADADRFSLRAANAPDGLARALVKTIEYRAASPSRLEEALFYTHPAVSRRIRRCMDWKATHPPGPPAS
jgi:STE24 endopeptidase